MMISLIALLVVLVSMYFLHSARKQVREELLAKENEQLRQTLKDQQESLEEERKRIGHDLHDDLAQLLAGTRLALENLRLEPTLSGRNKSLLLRIDHDLHDDLAQLLAGTRLALENLRLEPTLSGRNKSLLLRIDHDLNDLLNRVQNIIWNLAPESLREKGLSYVLWKMCDHLKELRSFHIEFFETGNVTRMPDEVEVTLFRIVQEIVNNAMRHSLAWNINMKMRWSDTSLRIEVKDDGIGKDRAIGERRATARGRGLPGMKRRAELIGATVVTEPIEKGTLFVVTYPYKVTIPLLNA